MSSIRRIVNSRAKRKSSLNAIRHGLLSKIVVMKNESRRGFDQLFGSHFQASEPANGVELALTAVAPATLDRSYERALRNMILLRAKPQLRNEPT